MSGSFASGCSQTPEVRAEQLGDAYVATEHLLISLATVDSDAKKVLSALNVRPNVLTRAFNEIRGSKRVDQPLRRRALHQHLINTVLISRPWLGEGKLDPVIGRDVEIRRVGSGACQAYQEQPVLIGEPGGGKTAVVEV
jgi:ATP-dependent Clp protease ATP-binding subunit ClpB